jgi:hypothetical protein
MELSANTNFVCEDASCKTREADASAERRSSSFRVGSASDENENDGNVSLEASITGEQGACREREKCTARRSEFAYKIRRKRCSPSHVHPLRVRSHPQQLLRRGRVSIPRRPRIPLGTAHCIRRM